MFFSFGIAIILLVNCMKHPAEILFVVIWDTGSGRDVGMDNLHKVIT